MRYMPFIAALVLGVSAQPAFADSYQFPRLSGTFCATDGDGVTRTPAVCFTTQETDSYKQVFIDQPNSSMGVFHTGENRYSYDSYGCWYMYSSLAIWRQYGSPSSSRICVRSGHQILGHVYEQFLFPDIPEEDRTQLPALYRVTIGQYMSNFNILKQTINIEKDISATKHKYCFYYGIETEHGYKSNVIALDRTPQSIMQACGFAMKKSDYIPPSTSQPDPSQEDNNNNDDQVSIPGNAKPCGNVNNGNENVAVRSEAPSCALAKRVIKRYSRTLRSPQGWSCKASMNDAKFRAKCAKKTTSRAKRTHAIYGVWIRR